VSAHACSASVRACLWPYGPEICCQSLASPITWPICSVIWNLLCMLCCATHLRALNCVEARSALQCHMQTVHICIWTSDSVLRMRRKRLSH